MIKSFDITQPYTLTYDQWENLWVCALEGGITYWGRVDFGDGVTTVGTAEFFADYTWRALTEADFHALPILVTEDDGVTHEVSAKELLTAVKALLTWGGDIERWFRDDNIDAEVADAWFQTAVFGDVVYG